MFGLLRIRGKICHAGLAFSLKVIPIDHIINTTPDKIDKILMIKLTLINF